MLVVGPDDRVTHRLSYAELDRPSTRCAWVLRAAALGVGDHVAVLMENRAELFRVVWGASTSPGRCPAENGKLYKRPLVERYRAGAPNS